VKEGIHRNIHKIFGIPIISDMRSFIRRFGGMPPDPSLFPHPLLSQRVFIEEWVWRSPKGILGYGFA